MKILISDVDGNAADRHGEQRCHEGGCGPMRFWLVEAAACKAPASVEQEEDCSDLPQQRYPWKWQVCEVDRERDEFVKDCGLKLHAEIVGVVREKRWVKAPFDGGQIE